MVIQNAAEVNVDLIDNKNGNNIAVKPPQNTSATVESETEIPKERQRKGRKIIDELRLRYKKKSDNTQKCTVKIYSQKLGRNKL